MDREKMYLILSCILTIVIALSMIFPFIGEAAYWAALPPYNALWPLWSSIFSPVDPVTGLATPLVTQLTKNTILPIQPCLAWDPVQPGGSGLPWALYNTPAALGTQLLFYDVYYGMNPWPPGYAVDPVTGLPKPIALPAGWSVLLPTSLTHLQYLIPLANANYSFFYGVPIANLLTSAQIWGLTPLALLPPSYYL